jgi:hypothetical protein
MAEMCAQTVEAYQPCDPRMRIADSEFDLASLRRFALLEFSFGGRDAA